MLELVYACLGADLLASRETEAKIQRTFPAGGEGEGRGKGKGKGKGVEVEEHLRLQMQRRTCAGQAAATGPRESVYSSNTVTSGLPVPWWPGYSAPTESPKNWGNDIVEGREKRGEREKNQK